MQELRSKRRERYAQAIASGAYESLTDAYEAAGFPRHRGNASAYAKLPDVSARVEHLIAERVRLTEKATEMAAERAAITLQSLIAEIDEARRGALADRNWPAVIAAVKEKGVLTGKRVERRESGSPGEFEWLERLDAAELERLAGNEQELAAYLAKLDPNNETRQ